MKLNEKISKKMVWDDRGVSEVIGTILLLMITVTLFSGIILWVNQLPEPEQSTYADLSGSIEPKNNDWNKGAWINITHGGGESLHNWSTRIYLFVDGNPNMLYIGHGLEGDDTWSINEVWTYEYTTAMTATTEVSVMVVDISKNTVVWSSDLLGGEGTHPPIFIRKWFDSIPSTATADPVEVGDTFTIYAEVVDSDYDLNENSVYVSWTIDDGGCKKMSHVDDIYSYNFINASQASWDGAIFTINATDDKGHIATTRLTLNLVDYGDIYNYAWYNGTGKNFTRPPNLKWSGPQGFNIFNKTNWDASHWNATPKRSFVKGEGVVVVVGSKNLVNVENVNSFYLFDRFTGDTIPKPATASTTPSNINAFSFIEYVSSYFIYEHRFETSDLDYGRYPFQIQLKDNWVPVNNIFFAVDSLNVTNSTGWLPEYPQLITYSDSGYTTTCDEFRSNKTIYVEIIVKSNDIFDRNGGDVEIRDFGSGVQVKRSPPTSGWNGPVSSVAGQGTSSVPGCPCYKFAIDLSKADQDPWIPGTQSYSVRFDKFKDANERYLLSKQITIIAPNYLLDIVVGTEGTTNNAWGIPNYINYYENDNLWTPAEIIETGYEDAKGFKKVTAIKFGDVDDDGKLDIIASIDYGTGGPKGNWIYVYDNDGSWTRKLVDKPSPSGHITGEITDIAVGNLDIDDDIEIIVGQKDGEVVYYRNDGLWTYNSVGGGAAVNAVAVGDMDGDGDNDIVAARDGGKNVIIYWNDGLGYFGTTTQYTNYTAIKDVLGYGTVSADTSDYNTPGKYYKDTWLSDNKYEKIKERVNESTPVYCNGEPSTPIGNIAGTYDLTHSYTDGATQNITENGTVRGLEANYTFVFSTLPTKNFNVSIRANWSEGAKDYIEISLKKKGTSDFDPFGHIDSATQTWINFTASTDYVEGSGKVTIKYKDSDQTGSDTINGTLRIDYQEVHANDKSELLHKWEIPIISQTDATYRFYLEAHHSFSNDGDNFTFAYSYDPEGDGTYTPYVDMLNCTVEKTIDNNGYQTDNLPTDLTGTVYIRVVDTDRTIGNMSKDTLFVDHMYIQKILYVPPSTILEVGTGNIMSVVIGDINGDGYNDIVAGDSKGEVWCILNERSLPFFSVPTSIADTGKNGVVSVGLGYFAGTDEYLDIAAAAGSSIYIYENNGAFPTPTFIPISTSPLSVVGEDGSAITIAEMVVGDIDGDWDTDIVVVGKGGGSNTKSGVFLFTNVASWPETVVETIGVLVYCIDLGDAGG